MSSGSVILVGFPDSGKTNYLARLWESLRKKKGHLICPKPPDNVKYLEEILGHLHQGAFAPRSDKVLEDLRKDVTLLVSRAGAAEVESTEVIVPDVSGELWKGAVAKLEITQEWMDELKRSSGAMLFLRVQSELNVTSVDWVTTRDLLRQHQAFALDPNATPTQVILSELLRFLELTLIPQPDGGLPRVAVVISAWDMLNDEDSAKGPRAFLASEFPLFAGRLKGTSKLGIEVFGVSIVGGDFVEEEFKKKYLKGDPNAAGYVVVDKPSGAEKIVDISLPLAWLMDGKQTW